MPEVTRGTHEHTHPMRAHIDGGGGQPRDPRRGAHTSGNISEDESKSPPPPSRGGGLT